MKEKDYSAYFHTDMIVREDSALKDISKLIFSDIAYFCFLGEGKCIATNVFFAKKYGKSPGTISSAISALERKGYIDRFLDQYKNRTIYVKRKKFSAESLNSLSSNSIDASEESKESAQEHLNASVDAINNFFRNGNS